MDANAHRPCHQPVLEQDDGQVANGAKRRVTVTPRQRTLYIDPFSFTMIASRAWRRSLSQSVHDAVMGTGKYAYILVLPASKSWDRRWEKSHLHVERMLP